MDSDATFPVSGPGVHNSVVVPALRMPIEVLSEIFQLARALGVAVAKHPSPAVNIDARAGLRLGTVCRHCRLSPHTTPLLWNKIAINEQIRHVAHSFHS